MRSASARRRSLFTTLCVPLLACTALVTLDPAPPPASAASGVDIRVGSFNIQSVSLDGHRGQQRPWKQRRGKIIRQIMGERVAVIGLQEANPSKHFRNRLVSGSNQYLDLKNGLNRAGGHFAVANRHAYNCVRSSTPYKCRHKDRNASNGDRILYNTRKLRLLSVNAMKYSRQSSTTGLYLAWARFRSRANGHTFLFATTHLDPRNRSTRKAQWRQMIRKINHVKHGRPVIVVGDFNTQKFDPMAKSMLPAMKRAGYGDVLNQKYRVNPSRPRAGAQADPRLGQHRQPPQPQRQGVVLRGRRPQDRQRHRLRVRQQPAQGAGVQGGRGLRPALDARQRHPALGPQHDPGHHPAAVAARSRVAQPNGSGSPIIERPAPGPR